jgi:hypothetical protein
MTWTWRPLTRLRYLDSSSCLDKSIVSQLNILVQYKCNQLPSRRASSASRRDLVGDGRSPLKITLSHTWGSDTNEVIFEDLKNGTSKHIAGHETI